MSVVEFIPSSTVCRKIEWNVSQRMATSKCTRSSSTATIPRFMRSLKNWESLTVKKSAIYMKFSIRPEAARSTGKPAIAMSCRKDIKLFQEFASELDAKYKRIAQEDETTARSNSISDMFRRSTPTSWRLVLEKPDGFRKTMSRIDVYTTLCHAPIARIGNSNGHSSMM